MTDIINKIIKSFREKFVHNGKRWNHEVFKYYNGVVVDAEMFLTLSLEKAIQESREETIKEIYNFGYDKERDYYDPRKSMAYLDKLFTLSLKVKEKK